MSRLLVVLTLFSLLAVALLYLAGGDTYLSLSPQGCRMSRMWPGYILQQKFDHTWTPLARRYTLWLYREGNLESNELHGAPVLFIPGNAGSSRQVRSIASSAANQYYSSPYQVSSEFANKGYSGLDVFAVEYNEDLSAFHGPTMDSQTTYASHAIDYILSLYAPNTSIVLMAHSMGGVVATALLPNPQISALITMSSPHIVPPVRFDRRIHHIYAQNHKHLVSDPTPILSLCGGATDLMIPSESCIISPSALNYSTTLYRRTVFTSALEGCWTGVGHLAMVWCHQVRWRVARAAIEITAAKTEEERAVILDRWLRDGHTLPPLPLPDSGGFHLRAGQYEHVPLNKHILVRDPAGSQSYLLPLPISQEGRTVAKLVLYASQGSIGPVAPHRPLPFRASVYLCKGREDVSCSPLTPSTLKLIPSPVLGSPFPVPDEGADESEGIVLFEADVTLDAGFQIAVQVEGGDRRGWVLGAFDESEPVNVLIGLSSLSLSFVDIPVPNGVRAQINLPNLPAHSLLVYRVIPGYAQESSCASDTLFLPLLTYSSHPAETHYFPISPTFLRPVLLHSHATAPYITSESPIRNVLTIHSSGECSVDKIRLQLDWWATIGRWGTRYWAAAACWAVGIVAVLMWDAWRLVESGGPIPTVKSSLELFARKRLPWMMLLSYFVSLLPLQAELWLGNRGNALFAPLAPLMLPISFGLVCVMWWLLLVLLWPTQRILRSFGRPRDDTIARSPMSVLFSMALIFLVIFFLVPWQVAYLGVWLIHFYTCASSLADLSRLPPIPETEAIPLRPATEDSEETGAPKSLTPRLLVVQQTNGHLHLLLFMTWLLPLVAPVLAVWVRTFATAGMTTPFDGDHNFLYVAPFLILVEVLGGRDAHSKYQLLFGGGRMERVSPKWGLAALAVVAFFAGPKVTYLVYETASVAIGWAVLWRIGPALYLAGMS